VLITSNRTLFQDTIKLPETSLVPLIFSECTMSAIWRRVTAEAKAKA